MTAPEQVVRGLLDSWRSLDVDDVVRWFAPDAVWEPVPGRIVTGRDDIRTVAGEYLRHMSSAALDVVHLACAGPVVLTERVDRFVYDGRPVDARVMGAFEVVGEHVVAWRDYFDTAHH